MGCNFDGVLGVLKCAKCFSTLYGSKWVATLPLPCARHHLLSFSTLYGSKWVATRPPRPRPHPLVRFQYPLRVEVGCNSQHGHTTVVSHATFQYPLRVEVGCNGMFVWVVQDFALFQYPLRVEVGCNSKRSSRRFQEVLVSVPSTGRSGLQHHSRWEREAGSRVSVPSTGRSGLQPPEQLGNRRSRKGFSTLYGSKWVATWELVSFGLSKKWFQYPLRVEVGCNLSALCRRERCGRVSVPSTGRSGLQPLHPYGISGQRGFQYPLRVEVGCNCKPISAISKGSQVSVPSTGRSGLQREVAEIVSYLDCVSVPSTGRSGLQPEFRLRPGTQLTFQYPLRVEVGCNTRFWNTCGALYDVSVPSTGRSGLQRVGSPDTPCELVVSVPSTGRSGLQPACVRGRRYLR